MKNIEILLPLNSANTIISQNQLNHWKKLYKTLKTLINDNKNDQEITTFMDTHNNQNINIIKPSISKPTFFKQSIEDKCYSPYNPNILSLWKANAGLQFVLEPYGLIHYLVNYINKTQKGVSKR